MSVVWLFPNVNLQGKAYSFAQDTAVLPPEIDGKARSLSVPNTGYSGVILYNAPNFQGSPVALASWGFCNDLSNAPGGMNLANWIRSLRTSGPHASLEELLDDLKRLHPDGSMKLIRTLPDPDPRSL